MKEKPPYPGIRVTANGNQLVSYHTETRVADAGIFYPITPSTEGGELYQQAFAEGKLNVFGQNTIAVEAEGEHAAQGGAIAHSVCGKRVVNYTSGQGVVYRVEPHPRAECDGRPPHLPSRADVLQARVGADSPVPGQARRHHRLSDGEPARALRAEAPPRAEDDRPHEPCPPRTGAEPRALHA